MFRVRPKGIVRFRRPSPPQATLQLLGSQTGFLGRRDVLATASAGRKLTRISGQRLGVWAVQNFFSFRLGFGSVAVWFAALLARGPLAPLAHGQGGVPQEGDDGSGSKGEEKFESVDPYTRGEDAALAALGYRSLGPFVVMGGRSTVELTQDLGGIGLIWIETAHFKLGSSLGTYKLKGDSQEKRLLAEECRRLKDRLPSFKLPTRALDPWLRAHLFAQRIEELYADFLAQTGFSEADFPPSTRRPGGPPTAAGMGLYLGQSEKFVVLLSSKGSTLGRFTEWAFKERQDSLCRRWVEGGGMFVGVSADSLKAHTEGLDVAIWCYAAFLLTNTFLEGLRNSSYCTPAWLNQGLAHYFSRRIDPRWIVQGGDSENAERLEKHYLWAPRVRALVDNGARSSWEEMMNYAKGHEIPSHEQMVVWSRAEFILTLGPERVRAWLLALTEGGRPNANRTSPEESARMLLERQKQANSQALGLDSQALEREWARWVKQTYPKK